MLGEWDTRCKDTSRDRETGAQVLGLSRAWFHSNHGIAMSECH